MEERRLEIEWREGRRVSAALTVPLHRAGIHSVEAALVLAHGAGGNLEDPLLAAVAEGLADQGLPSLRFNFPYRQEGRRLPDRTETLEACYHAVVAQARRLFQRPEPALVLGGKSLGGRMASHLAANPTSGSPVAGLVFLAYPLHPPGRPDKLRDRHLFNIRAPMLFVSGTRDAFAHRELLEPLLERLRPLATPHWMEGADHSFRVPRRRRAEVYQEVLGAVASWLPSVISSSR